MAPPPPEPASALPAPPGSSWRPYVIAFVIGAVVLTALPFVQRRFLKAPAPVKQLEPWALTTLGGGDVSSDSLKGQVVLLSAEIDGCDEACVARQRDFGTAIKHVDDLKVPVTLVTVVGPGAKEGLTALIQSASPAWRFAEGENRFLGQLQTALDAFLPPPGAHFTGTHSIVLIDQNNAVRGFWQSDVVGRGNAINAARLLSKEGPNP